MISNPLLHKRANNVDLNEGHVVVAAVLPPYHKHTFHSHNKIPHQFNVSQKLQFDLTEKFTRIENFSEPTKGYKLIANIFVLEAQTRVRKRP